MCIRDRGCYGQASPLGAREQIQAAQAAMPTGPVTWSKAWIEMIPVSYTHLGFHVLVGMLMLLFITLRLMKGHFTPERHFGFEGAAWYWHFVDVVWLGLYVVVYWL